MGTNENQTNRKKLHIEHWQIIALGLAVYDLLAVNLAYFIALLLRFDFRYTHIPELYLHSWLVFVPVYSVLCLVTFYALKLYQSLWRFASYLELVRVIKASIVTTLVQILGTLLFIQRMPISYYFMGALLQFLAILGIRFSYRFVLLLRSDRTANQSTEKGANVMLIGAGNAGQMILRDISKAKETNDKVCCFIDDNENKWHRYVDGVPIVGGRDAILESVEKYKIDKIYIAIPSASATQKRDLLAICKETDCELKQLPGIYQLVNGQVSVTSLKNVSVEDLLGREPIKADMTEVFQFIHGKRVMVTGGGGSIGSELARQIAAHGPELLLLFDFYENNVYDIQLELKEKYPDLNLVVLIGSVRDSRKVFEVFDRYRPQIVYHAAAHKHVPLMEDSPNEAIKNNVFGTLKTARAAEKYGCEKFVLISTDKAVNPTNIMGASKRICEMIIQAKAARQKDIAEGRVEPSDKNMGKTQFVAVRFGNVLGSNGSVIPLFKKQIEAGGPVTVTHPDIIRYFMTIPEAVSLVLQASVYASGGEIFVLDMGEPVKILELAENMIHLMGYEPYKDIDIKFTGLRPGEKLYEELLMNEEGLKDTPNKMIHIGRPIDMDYDEFRRSIKVLGELSNDDSETIKKTVAGLVPTYNPKNVVM